MARTHFAVLALALLCATAYAQPKVDPVANAAAGAVGKVVGPVVSAVTKNLIKPDTAAVVSSNAILAVNSAEKAHNAAGKLVGGLLTKSFDAHRQAGKILVEIVNAINSLNIAGINLAAGVTNGALSHMVGKIRTEALAIGNIYTELLGELGRFVGGSINAVQTLKRGVFVSPLELGVNHLEHTLESLITILKAAVSPSVASPDIAIKFAPHLATLKAVKSLLGALSKAIKGPHGTVLGGLDVAVDAAGDILGNGAAGAAGGIAGLISQAQELIDRIPGL